jgi:probable rRNA maturation factor
MITFFNEDIEFKLKNSTKIKYWLKNIAITEGFKVGSLNYIFCSDEYLLNVNREYLNHDFYTDIITFDNSEDESKIEGDVFVSIDRVLDNAKTLNKIYENELMRVLAHGVLHLVGYDDLTDEGEGEMRSKEDFYLNLI